MTKLNQDLILSQERLRYRELIDLGTANNMRSDAEKFHTQGKSVAEFRGHILGTKGEIKEHSGVSDADMLGINSEIESRGFSISRLMRATAGRESGFEKSEGSHELEISDFLASKSDKEQIRGVLVPADILTRDLTVGTDSAGGYLKPTQHLGFIDALRTASITGMLGATVLSGLRGDVSIPRLATKTTAYWVSENSAPSEGAPVFEQIALSPKTVAAYVDISRRLMIQSSPNADAVISHDIRQQLLTELDDVAIEGGGSNQPTGILNTSGIGSVAMGTNGGAPTWGMVCDIASEVEIDNAAIGKLGWAMNPQTKGKMAQTVKVASTDSEMIYESGDLYGERVALSNNVPSDLTKAAGSNLSALIYGNWSDLVLGIWGQGGGTVDLRLDPYSLSTTGAMRITAFLDVDVAVRHAQSFSASQDINTA